MKIVFLSLLLSLIFVFNSSAVTITNLSVKCTPSIIQINLNVKAVATISGTGSGKILYKWENGNDDQFHSTVTKEVEFDGSTLNVTLDSGWLWTNALGTWNVKFRIVSPDSIFADDKYEVVTNPFHVVNIQLKCLPTLVLVNGQVKATATISGTGYGVINYYWENRLNGTFHSSKMREAIFNLSDITIESDSGWVSTEETGTGELKLIITSPDSIIAQTAYRISLSDVGEGSCFSGIKISPNPAIDFLEISVGGDGIRSEQNIEIFSVTGVKMISTPFPFNLTPTLSMLGEGVKIDVSGLFTGVYLMRVGDKVSKFVKL